MTLARDPIGRHYPPEKDLVFFLNSPKLIKMMIHSFINRQESVSPSRVVTKKNPYTSENQHQFSSADLIQAVTAIQQSQKFFSEYRQSKLDERIQLLQKIKTYIEENKLKLARLEAQDQGLHFEFVLKYSIESALSSLNEVLLDLASTNLDGAQKYSPVGVISLITSWNLSFRVISERLFPAIAAGNTIVIKVSSMSPVTALILKEMIEVCDLPAGLIQVLLSNDLEVKKVLVTHPGVKAISFVGQLANASEVMKLVTSVSAQQFKKIQIASGTKNTAATIGEPSVDVFMPIMQSFLQGQGQLAWNSARLFMLEKNESLWHDRIKEFLNHLKPAESVEDPSLWTPVLKEESYKTFSEINALAVQDQARLIKTEFQLSEKQKKCFLPVTFTQDMSNCSTLQQDQVMSPLFILSTVKYPFDIQKYSNVSYFGLAAHLWGEPEKLVKIADSLEVGRVFKNKWSVQTFGASSAVKQSGFGLQDYRTFGDFFSNVKIVT